MSGPLERALDAAAAVAPGKNRLLAPGELPARVAVEALRDLEARLEREPVVVLVGETPPGWLARKTGSRYTETLRDWEDRFLHETTNVGWRPRHRQAVQLERFLRLRSAAVQRRRSLSQYDAFLPR